MSEPTLESLPQSLEESPEKLLQNSSGDRPPALVGGGWPVINYWAAQTLQPKGALLWKTLNHKSACLSCAWGTGGQKGGFRNEDEETLQRCAKSVEAIASELMEPVPSHFFDQYSIPELQRLSSLETNKLGRLSFPVILRAGSSHYQKISWAEVYDLVAAEFSCLPERAASYSSGRSSNEAAYLLQLMLRALGSNNLADCSDLCHSASTIGLKQMFGSGTSMVSLADLKQTDCVVLIGSNAPANHPRLLNELIQLRERGGTVIVVNPVKEAGLVKFASPAYPLKSFLRGSDIASLYLQPISGSDVALFVGIQKSLLEQGLVDRNYLQQYTNGWQEVLDQAATTSWEEIISTCGIEQGAIAQAAQMIGTSSKVVFAWAMGVTQQKNGVDNIHSIANTALITGNAGKVGAGTMPIRGHSNVQGFGSMGVTIHLKEEIRQALEKLLGKSLSQVPGYDTRALIEAADQKTIDTLLCLGGNLYAANPDSTQAKRALGNINTIIYVATKPNIGHFHGLAKQNTLILPVFTRFENPHKTTTESGNNFVRLNDAGSSHLTGKPEVDLISEVELITELAHRLLGDNPINWLRLQDTQYVRQLIAQTIPGYGAIAGAVVSTIAGAVVSTIAGAVVSTIANLDTPNNNLDDNPNATPEEFTIANRIFHAPDFPTSDRRATMFTTPLPDLTLPQWEDFGLPTTTPGMILALGTGRSYSQHNTVVYKEGDYYRGMPHRHCILMNQADAESCGWQEHQKITVRGDAGALKQVEIIYGAIRRGSALMFYPEVNVIFTAQIDPKCGTPAYKRVPVALYPEPVL